MAARWIASLMFGTMPIDPTILAGAILFLCAAALVAGQRDEPGALNDDPLVLALG